MKWGYLAEPRGRGWYVADSIGHDVLGIVFINKRAAVAAIRLMAQRDDTPPLAADATT